MTRRLPSRIGPERHRSFDPKSTGVSSDGCGSGFDRQPSHAPFRKSVLQTVNLEASGTQCSDGLEGQNAVRAAAIGDDLLVRRQFREATIEVGQGNVDGTRQVAQGEFILWPHVKHHCRSVAQTLQQHFARDRLKGITLVEIAGHNPFNLGNVALAEAAQRGKQIDHCVIGEAIKDAFAVTTGDYEASPPEALKVARRVGNRKTGAHSQDFHAALTLAEVLQQLQPVGVADRLRDLRETGEDGMLGTIV